MTRPRIALTQGDPGGIGPEVVLKTLSHPELPGDADFVVFGSRRVLEAAGSKAGLPPLTESVTLVEIDHPSPGDLVIGRPDPLNGSASFQAFERAVKEAEAGRLAGVVTAPISKHSWNLAGLRWAGHTDYLSRSHPNAVMSFFSDRLKVVLFSHHLPLREALDLIRRDALHRFLVSIHRILNPGGGGYRFLVAGLNPHAGEEGLLGREEIEEITPAIEAARGEGVPVEGPFPPDTICRAAWKDPKAVVIALYHDQGLIAFKLACFEDGVNVTLGLPFIRTSPDHGTAFDIAGQGKANPGSMLAAVRFARRLITRT